MVKNLKYWFNDRYSTTYEAEDVEYTIARIMISDKEKSSEVNIDKKAKNIMVDILADMFQQDDKLFDAYCETYKDDLESAYYDDAYAQYKEDNTYKFWR